MFTDLAKVKVKAGKGGDGVVAWRRELYVDRGGPSGGDGGKGGDIVFVGDKQLNTLHSFRYNQIIRAEDGQNGAKQRKHGRSAEDKIIKVPVGTVVKHDNMIVADIVDDKQRAVIAKGGDGGFGNAHFKSSTRQAPRVAELGEKGEEFGLELELKLLADVGLVGLPNAGKSTFLSVATNATPKIADYPFTTLEPNLGVHDIGSDSLLVADIPGLIEGASDGKGLGYEFLRHVERTAVLIHLVDANSDNAIEDYRTITNELKSYSIDLTTKKVFIVLSKIDGIDEKSLLKLNKDLKKETSQTIYQISSVKSVGINELMKIVLPLVKEYRQSEIEQEAEEDQNAIPTITLDDEEAWKVERLSKGVYKISGIKIEKFARRTDFESYEGEQRFRDILKKTGIMHDLLRHGVEVDDTIVIGDDEFEF